MPFSVHTCLRGEVRLSNPALERQHPAKNALRKSKKSCELTAPLPLKSAAGSPVKNAARKSKKSPEFSTPSQLNSAAQIVSSAAWLSVALHALDTTHRTRNTPAHPCTPIFVAALPGGFADAVPPHASTIGSSPSVAHTPAAVSSCH